MRDGRTAAIEVSGRTGEGQREERRVGNGRSETLAMAEGGRMGELGSISQGSQLPRSLEEELRANRLPNTCLTAPAVTGGGESDTGRDGPRPGDLDLRWPSLPG